MSSSCVSMRCGRRRGAHSSSRQLNKFCVTPRHFLLVTKEFEAQASPLTPSQLLAAYGLLRQLGAREKFLAFYNCGTQSGAS